MAKDDVIPRDNIEEIYTPEARKKAQEWADLFRKGTYFLDDEDIILVFEYMVNLINTRREERWKKFMTTMRKEEDRIGKKK